MKLLKKGMDQVSNIKNNTVSSTESSTVSNIGNSTVSSTESSSENSKATESNSTISPHSATIPLIGTEEKNNLPNLINIDVNKFLESRKTDNKKNKPLRISLPLPTEVDEGSNVNTDDNDLTVDKDDDTIKLYGPLKLLLHNSDKINASSLQDYIKTLNDPDFAKKTIVLEKRITDIHNALTVQQDNEPKNSSEQIKNETNKDFDDFQYDYNYDYNGNDDGNDDDDDTYDDDDDVFDDDDTYDEDNYNWVEMKTSDNHTIFVKDDNIIEDNDYSYEDYNEDGFGEDDDTLEDAKTTTKKDTEILEDAKTTTDHSKITVEDAKTTTETYTNNFDNIQEEKDKSVVKKMLPEEDTYNKSEVFNPRDYFDSLNDDETKRPDHGFNTDANTYHKIGKINKTRYNYSNITPVQYESSNNITLQPYDRNSTSSNSISSNGLDTRMGSGIAFLATFSVVLFIIVLFFYLFRRLKKKEARLPINYRLMKHLEGLDAVELETLHSYYN